MAKNVSKYFPLKAMNTLGVGEWDEFINISKSIYSECPSSQKEFFDDIMNYIFYNRQKDYINKMELKIDLLSNKEHKMFTLIYPVMSLWAENKQVYQPDKYFLGDLVQTNNFTITKNDLLHLPVKTFFLDIDEFSETYKGVFVNVSVLEKNAFCTMTYFNKEEKMAARYYTLEFKSDGTAIILEDYGKLNHLSYAFSKAEGFERHSQIPTETIPRIVFQLLLYLTSKEPDINESLKTKYTYRKPVGKPTNSFKEVQIHEVGVKYGKTIKRFLQEEKKKNHKKENEIEIKIIKEGNKRKSPRIHYRSAHWQRYRTGKGRVNTVTKWIEPVFVGAGNKKNVDVVIHKVQ